MARTRVDVDANISLSGLQDGIKRAVKPLEDLLRKASGPGANLMLTPKGAEYFATGMKNYLQPLSDNALDMKPLENMLKATGQLQGELKEAWKSGDTQAALQKMALLQTNLRDVSTMLNTSMAGVTSVGTKFSGFLKTTSQQFEAVRTRLDWRPDASNVMTSTVTKWANNFDQLRQFMDPNGAMGKMMIQSDAKFGVELKNAMKIADQATKTMNTHTASGNKVPVTAMRNYLSSHAKLFELADGMDKQLAARLSSINDMQTMVAELEQNVNRGVVLGADGQPLNIGDSARVQRVSKIESNARFNAKRISREIPFESLTGITRNMPGVGPEMYDNMVDEFTGLFGPTIDAFQSELKNVFSNILGGLGAAAIFLTIQSVAETNADLAKLTHNLEIYEKLISRRGEGGKAKEVEQLRDEIQKLAAISDMTTSDLSGLLVQLTRRGISTGGISDLLQEAQSAFENYGVSVQDTVQTVTENFQLLRKENLNPAVYAELIQVSGGNLPDSVTKFNELIESQATIGMSYEELIAASVYYASTSREVSDRQEDINEAVEEGTKLIEEYVEGLDNYDTTIGNLLSGDDIAQQQRIVGQALKDVWRDVLNASGLGGGSAPMLTLQTMALGVLSTIKDIAHFINNILNGAPILGVVANFVKIVSTIAVVGVGLRFILTLMSLFSKQISATSGAWQAFSANVAATRAQMTGVAVSAASAAKAVASLATNGTAGLAKLATAAKGLGASLRAIGMTGANLAVFAVIAGVVALGESYAARIRRQVAESARYNPTNIAGGAAYYEETDDRGRTTYQSRYYEEDGNLYFQASPNSRELDLSRIMSLPEADLRTYALGGYQNSVVAEDVRAVFDELNRSLPAVQSAREEQLALVAEFEGLYRQAIATEFEGLSESATQLLLQMHEMIVADPSARNSPEWRALAEQFEGETGIRASEAQGFTISTAYSRKFGGLLGEAFGNIDMGALSQAFRTGSTLDLVLRALGIVEDSAVGSANEVAQRLQEYRDIEGIVSELEELGRLDVEMMGNRATSDPYAYRRRIAQSVITQLQQAIPNATAEQTPVLWDAIGYQRASIRQINIEEYNRGFALRSDTIATMPQSIARYEQSIDNIRDKYDFLVMQLRGAETGELANTLEADVARAGNDLEQALNALSAYRFSIEEARINAVDALQESAAPAISFLGDTSKTVNEVMSAMDDILDDLRTADRDKVEAFLGRVDYANANWRELITQSPIWVEFESALAAAVKFDLDTGLVDRFMDMATNAETEYERIQMMLNAVDDQRLSGLGREGRSYLINEVGDQLFSNRGIISSIRSIRDDVNGSLESITGSISPADSSLGEMSGVLEDISTATASISEMNGVVALFRSRGPELVQQMIDVNNEEIDALNQQISSYSAEIAYLDTEIAKTYSRNSNDDGTAKADKDWDVEDLAYLDELRMRLADLGSRRTAAFAEIRGLQEYNESALTNTTQIIDDLISEQNDAYEVVVETLNQIGAALPEFVDRWAESMQTDIRGFAQDVEGFGLIEVSPRVEEQRERARVAEAFDSYRETLIEQQTAIQAAIETFSAQQQLIEDSVEGQLVAFTADQQALYTVLTSVVDSLESMAGVLTSALGDADGQEEAARNQLRAERQKAFLDRQAAEIAAKLQQADEAFSEGNTARAEELITEAVVQQSIALNYLDSAVELLGLAPDAARELREQLEGLTAADLRKQDLERRIADAEQRLSNDANGRGDGEVFENFLELEALLGEMSGLGFTETEIGTAAVKLDGIYSQYLQSILDVVGTGNKSVAEVRKVLERNGLAPERIDQLITGPLASYFQGNMQGVVSDVTKMVEELSNMSSRSDPTGFQNSVGRSYQYIQGAKNFLETMKEAGIEVDEALFETLGNLESQVLRTQVDDLIAAAEAPAAADETPLDRALRLVQAYAGMQELLNGVLPEVAAPFLEDTEELRDTIIQALQEELGLGENIDYATLLAEWRDSGSNGDSGKYIAERLFGSALSLIQDPEVLDWIYTAVADPLLDSMFEALRETAENTQAEAQNLMSTFAQNLKSNPEAAMTGISEVVTAMTNGYRELFQAYATEIENETDEEARRGLQAEMAGELLGFVNNYSTFLSTTLGSLNDMLMDGSITQADFDEFAGVLDTMNTLMFASIVPNLGQMAEYLGITEEALGEAIQGMISLAEKLKEYRNELAEAQANIRLGGAGSREEMSLMLSAAELSRMNGDPNSNRMSFIGGIDSFASDFLSLLRRQAEAQFDGYLLDDKDQRVNTFYASLIQQAMQNPSAIAQQYGVNLQGSESGTFNTIFSQNMQFALQELTDTLKDVPNLMRDLLTTLQDSLTQLFMDLFSIPARMMQDLSALAAEREDLLFDADLVSRNISVYEELYQQAVETFGAGSEEANKYREKLVELREEHDRLNKSIQENEDATKSFFEYAIEAIGNFAQAFANAMAQILAERAAAAAVGWVMDLFMPNSTGGGTTSSGGGEGSPFSVKFDSGIDTNGTPDIAGSAANAGISAATGAAQTAAHGWLTSALIGQGATAAAASGGATAVLIMAAVAVGAVAAKVADLAEKYGELAQTTTDAGKNRFAENPDLYNFIDYDRGSVNVRISGELNRQRLAQEASEQTYRAMGRRLVD